MDLWCNVNGSNANGIFLFVSIAFFLPISLFDIFFAQTHHDNNSDNETMMLLLTLSEFIYGFGLMLITCEMGQNIYDAFDRCSDMIERLDWYLFPAAVQQTLPIIINFAQQPIVFKCFGSTACVRATFKRVCIELNRIEAIASHF